MAVAAPKRRSSAAPAPAPSRTAPPKRRKKAAPAPKPKPRRNAQPRLALVVGRTAAGVRHLPDSGLIVRMTRGRTWIAVLGVLLVGIVALNVVTLSFAASAGKVDAKNLSLEKENSMLKNRASTKLATKRIHQAAVVQGLTMPTEEAPSVIQYEPKDVQTAAQRLAGAG